MDVEKLLKVKRHITRKPSRLRMSNWIINKLRHPNRVSDNGKNFCEPDTGWGEPEEQRIPDCGTVACIAGWTVQLFDENPNNYYGIDIAERAAQILETQSNYKLFYVSRWPAYLESAYISATTSTQRAKIVGKAIDYYIETYATREEKKVAKFHAKRSVNA